MVHATMVNTESEIIPPTIAGDDVNGESETLFSNTQLTENENSLLREVPPSRPILDRVDGGGWMDLDHFSDDLPSMDASDCEGWREVYNKIEEITVNDSMQKQWKNAKQEIKQIKQRCYTVLDEESPNRQDFIEYYYGINSVLF